jgi:hypothetical protein
VGLAECVPDGVNENGEGTHEKMVNVVKGV